jgi:hypothetical protein
VTVYVGRSDRCDRVHVVARVETWEFADFIGKMSDLGVTVEMQTTVPSWFEFCHDEECKEAE